MLPPRPAVETAPTASNPAEQFQNQTLRPILKGQNEALLAHFRHYMQKRKGAFYRLPEREQLDYVAHALRTDQKFKNFLVGMVAGWFSDDERAAFFADEASLTRRTTDLLIQRLQSQRAALV